MSTPYEAPKYGATGFNCPHCGAFSTQKWWRGIGTADGGSRGIEGVDVAFCERCDEYSLWHHEKMILPAAGTAPLPNPDLPDEIKADYVEARSIVSLSPRGASALLRLAIQKLSKHLGEKGENINDDIASLVKKGLPAKVQKALDIVRVVGNNAVHPGQIDLKDDAETAEKLFGLINLITEVMISQPKHVDQLYAGLPESQRQAIAKRDDPA